MISSNLDSATFVRRPKRVEIRAYVIEYHERHISGTNGKSSSKRKDPQSDPGEDFQSLEVRFTDFSDGSPLGLLQVAFLTPSQNTSN